MEHGAIAPAKPAAAAKSNLSRQSSASKLRKQKSKAAKQAKLAAMRAELAALQGDFKSLQYTCARRLGSCQAWLASASPYCPLPALLDLNTGNADPLQINHLHYKVHFA